MRSHPRVRSAAVTAPATEQGPPRSMPIASRRELFKLFDERQRHDAPTPARYVTVPDKQRAWNTCAGYRLRLGKGTPSLRVAAAMSDRRPQPEAPATEIAIDELPASAELAEPRRVVQAIESEQPSDSGQVEIVAPATSCEVRLETETIVSRESIVSDQERSALPTFRQAQDAHAREYLTRVLTATGGERTAAARIAGVRRTHLHSLIKRLGIAIPMDPKARGRRRRERCVT